MRCHGKEFRRLTFRNQPGGLFLIAILLATYNGRRFLPALLESLQGQSLTEWRLFIRDDGSSDDTREYLSGVVARDRRMTLLGDREPRLGTSGNFNALSMAALSAGAEYCFFADQDDVWLPSKLSDSMQRIRGLERQFGRDFPCLVHSDLHVVNEQLTTIHPSHFRYARMSPSTAAPFPALLVGNFVTGCTMAVNRAALDVALPIPRSAVIHDWWIAQCAAARGIIDTLPQSTILYRQHGRNLFGAKSARRIIRGGPARILNWWRCSRGLFPAALGQALALRERLESRFPGWGSNSLEQVQAFCDAAFATDRKIRLAYANWQATAGHGDAIRRLLFLVRMLTVSSEESRAILHRVSADHLITAPRPKGTESSERRTHERDINQRAAIARAA